MTHSLFLSPLVQQFTQFYRANKALTVEVLGINTPRTLITRNKDEMIDTAFNEFMNSIGYFGGLKLLGIGMNRFLKGSFPAVYKNAAALRYAKTAFLVPAFMGYMIALPFYRNAMTAWRAKAMDFRELITRERRHDPQNWQRFAEDNMRTGHKALLLCLGVGLALTVPALSRPRMIQRLARQHAGLFEYLTLAGKTGERLKNDFQAIAYWGVPTYLAWIASSRDKFEAKEQVLRMVNFCVMFSAPGFLVNQLFKQRFVPYVKRYPKAFDASSLRSSAPIYSPDAFKQLLKNASPAGKRTLQRVGQRLQALSNQHALASFALTTLLMAISPAIINIFLTKNRMALADKQAQAAMPIPMT